MLINGYNSKGIIIFINYSRKSVFWITYLPKMVGIQEQILHQHHPQAEKKNCDTVLNAIDIFYMNTTSQTNIK